MAKLFTKEQIEDIKSGTVIVEEEIYFDKKYVREYLVCNYFEEIDECNAYHFQLVDIIDSSILDIKGISISHLLSELEKETEGLDVKYSIKEKK